MEIFIFCEKSYLSDIREMHFEFEKISIQLHEHSKSLPHRGSQAMIREKFGEPAKSVITAQSKTVYKAKELRGYLPGNDEVK